MRVYANYSNTVYKESDGTYSAYINDDSDTEKSFQSLASAIKYADENETE